MPAEVRTRMRSLALPLALALALTGTVFLLQRRIDFNVSDEGFLWEGVVLTAHGKVPLRDFYSYDPGRYLWAAAWAKLLGEGILALRLSTAIFQAGGLLCGLLAARRALPRAWQLVAAGVLLVLWMGPRHKLFEPALAMAAVYVAVLLIERPSPRRHLLAGALVGFAGVMGKNHGGYALLAFLLLIVWLHLRRIAGGGLLRDLGWWLAGIAAGALPLLAMLACVPRFFAAYLDSITFFLHQGRTNFGLPVPWPWVGGWQGLAMSEALDRLALGTGFLLLPAGVAAALLFFAGTTAANAGRRALLLAGGTLGLVYLHHAFSRADPFHLMQSIHPVLLSLLGLPAALEGRPRRWLAKAAGGAVAALLAFLTLFAAVPQTPWAAEQTARKPLDRFVPCRVGDDELRIPARSANLFAEIAQQITARTAPGEPVLLIPHLPGLYPALGRESPISDFYPIWPAQGERDARMRYEILTAGVRLAVYTDYTAGEEPALQFPNTHPLVWRYLQESFTRIPDPRLPRHVWLLERAQ